MSLAHRLRPLQHPVVPAAYRLTWVARRRTAAAVPWLRVVGLTYTGVGGLLCAGLLGVIALAQVNRAVEQVAQTPYNQAPDQLLAPTTVLPSRPEFAPRPPVFGVAPPTHELAPVGEAQAALLLPELPENPSWRVLEVPAEAEPTAAAWSPRARIGPPLTSPVREPALAEPDPTTAEDLGPGAAAGDGGSLDEQTSPIDEAVALAVDTDGQRVAAESVQPLSALPTPTETPLAAKARQDAANQAAIDAAKAANARAKAEAEAANAAAIEAARTATAQAKAKADAANEAAIARAKTAPPPSSPALPKAQADTTNQAAIDAANAARAAAKARADAANQAAIAAARATRATPTPTPLASGGGQP